MAFLAGHWRGEHEGGVIEEMWLAPSAGVAQGTVRLVQAGKVHTIELIIVAAESDRVVMRYNHFDPDYRTWEDDGPITLTLMGAHEDEVIFWNLDDQPTDAEEMGYRLTGPDTLHSWVFAIGPDGKVKRHSFDYRRVG